MTDEYAVDRRRILRGIGGLVIAGSVAGCSGSSGGGSGSGDGGSGSGSGSGDGGDGDGGSDGSGGGTTADSDSSSGSGGGGSSGDGGASFDGYLEDVGNFDGSVADKTGASEATVTVGTEANGGGFGFGPAAVRVSAGTTVVWEWNGEGGSHNVVAEDGSFQSDLVGEEGHSFSHTFESSGTYEYYCQPHKTLGMKGVVVVE